MRRTMCSAAILMLAATTVAACGGGYENGTEEGPSRPIAHLWLVDGSADRLQIDDSRHEGVVVKRGQRVEWRCGNCPEGVEFTVDGLHFVQELEGPDHRPEPPHGSPGPCDQAAQADQDRSPRHPLFADWSPPGQADEWAAAGEGIVSGNPVPNERIVGVAHGLWKYSWKVRRVGEPESAVCWDPHIFGHPGLAF